MYKYSYYSNDSKCNTCGSNNSTYVTVQVPIRKHSLVGLTYSLKWHETDSSSIPCTSPYSIPLLPSLLSSLHPPFLLCLQLWTRAGSIRVARLKLFSFASLRFSVVSPSVPSCFNADSIRSSALMLTSTGAVRSVDMSQVISVGICFGFIFSNYKRFRTLSGSNLTETVVEDEIERQ